MSRAFVKEDGPEDSRLPDLPLSPHPNYVTQRGLRQLQDRLALRLADLAALKARPDRLDRQPEAAAERDIRYLEARLKSAIPVTPPDAPQEVTFGVAVTVSDDAGRATTWTLVGEDEADPAARLISSHTPLARAMLGAGVGETVQGPRGPLCVLALAPG